jgi:hypothetical protein
MNVHDDIFAPEFSNAHSGTRPHTQLANSRCNAHRAFRICLVLAAAIAAGVLGCVHSGRPRAQDFPYSDFGVSMEGFNPQGVWRLLPEESLRLTRHYADRPRSQPVNNDFTADGRPAAAAAKMPVDIRSLTIDAEGTLELQPDGDAKLVFLSRKDSASPMIHEELEGTWSKGERSVLLRVTKPAEAAGAEIVFERRSYNGIVSRRGDIWHVWKRWDKN